jgi:hypothetical protein
VELAPARVPRAIEEPAAVHHVVPQSWMTTASLRWSLFTGFTDTLNHNAAERYNRLFFRLRRALGSDHLRFAFAQAFAGLLNGAD